MHIPVLCKEVLSAFQDRLLSTFVDGTLGFGGHAEAILEAHPELVQFIGLDQDAYALAMASKRLEPFGKKVTCLHGNFRDLPHYVKDPVDGILLDIGVSSVQLDRAERGFSFSSEGPLDMRMNQESRLDAKTIINTYPEKELARILFEYGEVRGSRRLAKIIVEARKKKKLETTQELSALLTPVIGYHPKRLHPMTLVFQALRIEVNDELGALSEGLKHAFSFLNPGGRLCVISFHSLEDRIVKNFFRERAQSKQAMLITKKPLVASMEEERKNPRSRSAKLRVLEKN